ncbi:MAG: ATP-binding cassette domain-containing protein [Chloroflexi bacterium]|nr:ATP-binding cassette domain-containing protein [Chloroflexota bacterium]
MQKSLEIPKPTLADADGILMRNVIKTFKTPAGQFSALKNVSLGFTTGDFAAITGKSGSGKSTLINMITGIDVPSSGEVCVGGVPVHQLSESQMAIWRGRNLGIVFQFFQLLPTLSLLENTMLPMDIAGVIDISEREKRAMRLLKMVGLEDVAHKMPLAVSGGQQQAAAIARALANDPPFLVADEPTGNLDSRTAENVFEIFEQLSTQGKTILMITHDPALAQRTARQVLLSDGEIVNPWIHKTFPMLNHAQMLRATHQLESLTYRAGEPIIRQGEPSDALYILTQGRVDVSIQGQVVARLSPGDFFGEMELLDETRAVATVQAASDEKVETVSLGRGFFSTLMDEARALRDMLTKVVRERAAQNLALIGSRIR